MVRLYNWDEWFKKNRFELRHGKHFQCSVSGMVQQVRSAASKAGLKVSVRDKDGKINVLVKERNKATK